jgi:5-methylcytosine-specific restriction endonuclease McrA
MQIPNRPPSRDHIKSRSKGHTLDEGNRALVCCRCNHDKGSRSLGSGLRACHELATLAPIMWRHSLSVS